MVFLQELAGLRDFYEANLELANPKSPISVFDVDQTIVSRGHILPPSIVHQCEISDSLVGEGSILMVPPPPQPIPFLRYLPTIRDPRNLSFVTSCCPC